MKCWIITQYNDSICYNVMAKTKKEAVHQAMLMPEIEWKEIFQVEINGSIFDIIKHLTSESGGRNPYSYDRIISQAKFKTSQHNDRKEIA